MKIVAVWTGLSEESTTTKLAERMINSAVTQLEEKHETAEVVKINLRELAMALSSMTVSMAPSAELERAFDDVRSADAVITATPIYKAAPVGLHTLFWQLIDDESLAGTPTLIGATGGTPRHSLATDSTLRPLLAYLKALVLPTSVFAATDDWGDAQAGAALDSRIDDAVALLVALATGDPDQGHKKSQRSQNPLDPATITPFDELLAAHTHHE